RATLRCRRDAPAAAGGAGDRPCRARRRMCPVPPQDAVPSQVAGPQGRNPGPVLDLEPPMTTTWSALPRAARDIAPRSAGPDGPGSGFDRNARRDGVDDPDITR